MTQSKCPASLNYAMVRLKEEKGASKKVLLPNSLAALKKNIRVLFKLNDPIQSLYTEDGHQVQFLGEIVPGEILYASTQDINFQTISSIPKPPSPAIYKVNNQSSESRGKSPRSKLKANEPQYETFGLSPNIVAIGNLSPLLVDQSKLHYTIRDTKHMKQKEAEETEEESAEKRRIKELEKYAEQLPDSLKRLFNIVGDESWIEDLLPLFQSLPLMDRVLMVDSERITKEQSDFWLFNINKMLNEMISTEMPEHVISSTDIRQFCGQIIENHRVVTSNEVSINMRCVVVGPRKSGKSLFLKQFSQRLAIEFMRTGNLAHKFIVAFDMKRLSLSLSDYTQFYTDMVDIVCHSLSLQKPILSKLIKNEVKPFLLSVMNPEPPVLKKQLLNQHEFKEFFNNLQSIGELLNLFWNDAQCLTQWYTNVSFLPVLIGGAAGYDETFFIIDHLDYCDQSFVPNGRFAESGESIFVSEYYKFTLSNSSFIAACEDPNKLYQLLVDVDDTFSYAPFEFISMDEIESDAAKDETLIFEIDGLGTPLTLRPDICAGIPAYIALWNSVVDVVNEVGKLANKKQESDDMRLLSVSQAQSMLDIMFVIDNNVNDDNYLKSIIVTDVRLKQK